MCPLLQRIGDTKMISVVRWIVFLYFIDDALRVCPHGHQVAPKQIENIRRLNSAVAGLALGYTLT